MREPWVPAFAGMTEFFVIPAEAGIQSFQSGMREPWIPACAGMTRFFVIPAEAGIQRV